MKRGEVAFTTHALERLVEMEVPPEAITQTLESPDWRFVPAKYPDREDLTSDAYDLTLCITRDPAGCTTVITAMPSSQAGWDRLFRLGLAGPNRTRRYLPLLRPDPSHPMTDPTREAS